MKAFRWIICFPSAMTLSFIAAGILITGDSSFHYGRGIFQSIFGLRDLWIFAIVPSVVFVVSGALISPSKKRRICFIFFGLSPLFSGSGIRTILFYNVGDLYLWIASNIGIIIGSFIGLLVSLRLQTRRNKKTPSQP
jgi:hypothetical protein